MPQCVVQLDVDGCGAGSGASASARRTASDPCVFAAAPAEQRRRRVAPPPPPQDTVRAEFVYADGGTAVSLCGDWNRWRPQAMDREPDGMWSVIVTVPTGRREFCYYVDGRYAVSRRHPTNAEKSANWRTVNGPPADEGGAELKKIDRRPALLRVADRAALSLRAALLGNVLPLPLQSDAPRRARAAGVRCVASLAAAALLATALIVAVVLLSR